MQTNSPKVSVLMPVFNGEKYLKEAINSILEQRFTDYEFIIIDDGSTDKTQSIICGYSDPRIIYMRNDNNIGVSASLNKGLGVAKGDFIARMDADDISLSGRFLEQVDFLDKNLDVGVLGAGMEYIDEDSNFTGHKWENPETSNLIVWTLFFRNAIVHPSVMMRRDILVQVGGYHDLHVAQDYDLWCRLSRVTKLYNLPRTLMKFRQHDAQLTNAKKSEYPDIDLSISHRMFADFFEMPIPVEWMRCIAEVGCDTSFDDDVISDSCELILELYRKFSATYSLREEEFSHIREFAAQKILDLARKGGCRSVRYGIKACILNPRLVKKISKILDVN